MKKNENLNTRPSQKMMTELENLYKLNQFDSLEDKTRKLIENHPRVSILYNILGITLQKKGDFNESILNFNQAINIQPNFDIAHNNLGNVLKDIGKFKEAIISYQQALKLNPNYAEAYSNLGNALSELGKFKEAIAYYQQALKLNPKYTLSNYNEGLIRLILGEFDIGWKKYEYRFGRARVSFMRYKTDKLWDGNYLDGTLLVWAEQGIGDHILFASMLTDLRKYAKNIILEIDKRLVNLFKRYCKTIDFLNIEVKSTEKKFIDNYDKHIAIGSLGQYLRKSKKFFKTTPIKYFISSPLKEKELRKKFFLNKKFKIGVSWKTLNKKQQNRNIDLEKMLPILSNPNCDFINLQFGKFDEDIKNLKLKYGINIQTIKDIDNYNDIEGLAALINCLDLVITIQNSTAHLAAALGKNTWIMLVKNPRWHWLINKKKSLWYPAAKLFRQEKIGDWNTVIKSIGMDLKKIT